MLTVVIAEDNETIRKNIIDVMSKVDGIEIIYSTDNGIDLLNVLKKTKPDIVISDIEMPGMTGLEVIQNLRQDLPDTEIIFVSAYNRFIRQAIQLYALDFIEKPLNPSRLVETVERIKRRLLNNEKLLEFKAEGSFTLVKAKDLYFVEADKKKTNVYTETGHFISTYSLKEVEEILNEEFFFKASRSYIINLKKVRGIKPLSRTSFQVDFDKQGWTAFLSKNRYEDFRINLKKYF